jgi:hypothetical protein
VPYVDLARSRIVLPAEFVKAVKDQWVPLDPELRAALLQLPRHAANGRKVFRFTSRKNGVEGTPLGGSANPCEDGANSPSASETPAR